ncbi:MAG: hypothetical protein IPL73_29410 [Candidatus Obscuribacter sp.]|nr:hypothetical protein [Candidatus Obscuribacter sp.]
MLKANNNGLQERMDKIICARTYSLEEYKTAFELVVSGKEMKLVFTP